MATPDLTAYTDLVLYDADPQDLVDRALLDLEAKLPDVDLGAGNVETVMLEAVALAAAEVVYAINRIPSAVIDLLMGFTGAERSSGAPATGTVTFTVSGTGGATIPAGTEASAVTAEDVVFSVTTDDDLIIPVGQTTGDVAVTATDPGTDPNGVPAATRLDLVNPIVVVDDVSLATPMGGGTDPEADAEWMARAVARIARFTDLYVRPVHFQSAALDHAGVLRARAVDTWDPALNAGAGGTSAGHVTVAVAGTGGLALSTALKAEVAADLTDHASADLAVHVVNATVTTVNVAVTVAALPGATTPDVQAAVEAEVRAYLDPDAWPWAGTVRRNELIAAADRAEGVDYVVTVATPAADQALTGLAPLAKAGTVTVTVNQP